VSLRSTFTRELTLENLARRPLAPEFETRLDVGGWSEGWEGGGGGGGGGGGMSEMRTAQLNLQCFVGDSLPLTFRIRAGRARRDGRREGTIGAEAGGSVEESVEGGRRGDHGLEYMLHVPDGAGWLLALYIYIYIYIYI
jgi:hypothetical protein